MGNTLDKNLPKLEEDTLSPPATMLVNFFSVSQLIPKIHAWAVPKMPHFGENSEIWPRYWQSKLKSRFLPPSFSRPTSISKWVGAPDYVCTSHAGTAGALVVMTVVLVKKERKLSKNI